MWPHISISIPLFLTSLSLTFQSSLLRKSIQDDHAIKHLKLTTVTMRNWSGNLRALWKVICVDGVLLGQTRAVPFSWSGPRREDALLKQARERTRDGRFFVNDTHVLVRLSLCSWSAFAGLHRRATPLMLDGNHTLKGSEYGSRGKECSALFMNTWSAHPSIGKPFAWVFWSTIRMCVCAQVCVMAKGWC